MIFGAVDNRAAGHGQNVAAVGVHDDNGAPGRDLPCLYIVIEYIFHQLLDFYIQGEDHIGLAAGFNYAAVA